MNRLAGSVLLALLLMTTSSCRDRARPAAAPRRDAARTTAPQTTVSQSNARQQVADFTRARATLRDPVFFDFDESTLRPDARATLDVKVRLLQTHPELMLTIAGHADERGLEAHNLALGQRRAEAVRGYLVDQGVPRSRLETTSYGERRPADRRHIDAAWARNRRAEFTAWPR